MGPKKLRPSLPEFLIDGEEPTQDARTILEHVDPDRLSQLVMDLSGELSQVRKERARLLVAAQNIEEALAVAGDMTPLVEQRWWELRAAIARSRAVRREF